MDASLSEKVSIALARIREYIDRVGVNRVCVAFSGGKDSEAVLRLAREVEPGITVIHNGHRGEHVEGTRGVLFVKEPKAENVPKFLSTVQLLGQIDGTRRAEDKMVRFDGEEIHRSQMTREWTSDGVWGLCVLFPVWDWTDEEVFAYLSHTAPVDVHDVKESYEGEGPLLGLRTVFCRTAAPRVEGRFVSDEEACSWDTMCRMYPHARAVYVVADKLSVSLLDQAAATGRLVTIETKLEEPEAGGDSPSTLLFQLVSSKPSYRSIQLFVDPDGLYCRFSPFPGFIKIRVKTRGMILACLQVAELYAGDGHQVLLMPEYDTKEAAQDMLTLRSRIRGNIRFMPPVQNLLGID